MTKPTKAELCKEMAVLRRELADTRRQLRAMTLDRDSWKAATEFSDDVAANFEREIRWLTLDRNAARESLKHARAERDAFEHELAVLKTERNPNR